MEPSGARHPLEGLNKTAVLSAVSVTAIGVAVLAGWMFDVGVLKSVMPGWTSMKANTAMAFVMSGLALLFLQKRAARTRDRLLGMFFAALVGMLGLLTLGEYVFGWDIGIDQFLVREIPGAVGTSHPGRMSPVTALSFLLIGAAFLTLELKTRSGRRPSHLFILPVFFVSFLALIGYLYRVPYFYGVAAHTKMAIHTAACLMMLVIGIFSARPDPTLVGVITGEEVGWAMARRVLPLTAGMFVLIGWLRLRGQEAGWYGTEFGTALGLLSDITLLAVVVFITAVSLNRADEERRKKEELLRSGEERTRLILEKSFNAFISIDATGVITEWNAQAESTFGWTRREAIGQKLADTLIPPGMRDAHLNGIQRFIETGAGPVLNRRIEMTAMHRDGHEFSVEMVISPIRHGGTYSFCAFLHDISQRRAAARRLEEDVKVIGERNQELGRQQKIMISLMEDLRESEEKIKKTAAELERSNKELEQFAYIASHDLQEPLRKISSFTQLLAQRYAGRLDKDADEFIGYVVDGAKRMRDLIEDLLTYSRVGRAEIAFERTDMTELMGQITALFDVDRAITAAEITHDPLPTVRANPLLIRQLLQNLISNGIKFHGDSPPRVHVSASRKGGEWIFSVRDNGIGIESQFHDRIFEIFKRLHTTEEFSGTGIGLAVCKKIAERHGGRIWVESTPGGGSTFYFSIPAREGAAADVSGDKSEGGVRS